MNNAENRLRGLCNTIDRGFWVAVGIAGKRENRSYIVQKQPPNQFYDILK
jgi:hypothetical protein